MSSKVVKILGYAAFSGFVLLVSMYLTFPSDAVAQRLSHEIQRASGGAYVASLGSISPYWFTGVEVTDVKLRSTKDADAGEIRIDRFRARVQILPLFLLSVALSAQAELGEGSVVADISAGENDAYDVELEIDELDFLKPPVLPAAAGFPFGGKLSGKASLTMGADVRKGEGKASLTVREGSVGPGDIKGFSLPRIGLGQLDVALDLRGGRLRLASFQQKGGDINVEAQGNTTLQKSMGNSRLDFCLKVKATDDFLDRETKFKTVLDLAQVQFKKDKEGFLNLPLRGSFSRMTPGRNLCRDASTPRTSARPKARGRGKGKSNAGKP